MGNAPDQLNVNEKMPPAAEPEANEKGTNAKESSPVVAAPTTTNSQQALQPNYDESIAFLRQFHPGRRWVLSALLPGKNDMIVETFDADRETACRAWLNRHNKTRSIYFSVGEVLRDVTKKTSREDIHAVHWLHVDIDPRAGADLATEQQRIAGILAGQPGGLPEPTVVVFSGGGYQAFWQLAEPIVTGGNLVKAEDAALYNLAIEMRLSADHTHNIDRVMRLPGTINWPCAKKQKKGRTPALAQVVTPFRDAAVYPLSMFEKSRPIGVATSTAKALPVTARRAAGTAAAPSNGGLVIDDVHDLSGLDDFTKVVIVQGDDPDDPYRWAGDRSKPLFFVCNALARASHDVATIIAVITDPGFGISASVLDKGRAAERYALRQAEQAAGNFRENNGKIIANDQRNVRLALHKLGVEVSFDEFSNRLRISGLPGHGPTLNDAAISRLWLTIDETYQFRPDREFFLCVVQDLARQNTFHPVCDYLAGLMWDGVPRLDRWLVTYGGAEDTEFNRAVGPLVLVAAVRRVREPGCKFDEMLVLESAQGQGKSTALRVLSVNDDWFTDDLPLGGDTKRQIEGLSGRWIVEAGELKGMNKGDVEALKGFLSRQVDTARLAWGKLVDDYPRQCVIVGTTNADNYLKDSTGNRRFWPVRVDQVDVHALRRDRDQLWAEAAHREAAGESIRLDPKFWMVAAEQQDQRRVEDPFAQRLAQVVGDLNGKLRAEDVWTILGVPPGQRTQDQNGRLGAAMKTNGWERKKLRFGGKPEYCYVRGEGPQANSRILVSFGPDNLPHAQHAVVNEETAAEPQLAF
ncbi:MAG TPA: VapE domain-containing protein [Tepidisphaeraceae bacterium]|jgi:predicted P-loop ATPase